MAEWKLRSGKKRTAKAAGLKPGATSTAEEPLARRAKVAAAFPVFVYLLYGHAPPEYITWGAIFVTVPVVMKHYENMERLIAGEEPRLRPPKH